MTFKKCVVAVALVLATLIAIPQAQADIVLTVETDNTPVMAGQTAFVTVFAESTEAAGETVQAFGFPIDVGGDGNMLPSDIVLNADPIQNEIDGLAITDNQAGGQNNLAGSDFIANFANNPGITVPNSPIALFDIAIDVQAGAAAGFVPVELETGLFFSLAPAAYGGTAGVAVAGGFTITAIPEPTAGIVLALPLLIGMCRRRRS